ncbi:DUF6064 family protein [Ramlibacter sp. MMS24-I3-19]|uniref:DUF6064 family protein n=1 Tax=Ramlibacter sp. MMS24-I3-19 TaxID=3416606 RepID=UPI003D079769
MSEWWTYRPASFLMFSARTWGRLLEDWNRELWPLQPAFVLAGAALVVMAARPPVQSAPWITGTLALAWAWVGWAFHWQRFADINTGAPWFAVAFALQAVLLLALGTGRSASPPSPRMRIAGLGLAALAVLAYPLAAPLAGRDWAQAEVAGAMPTPTALLTVGLVLASALRRRAWLLAIPVLALVVGWGTDLLLATR